MTNIEFSRFIERAKENYAGLSESDKSIITEKYLYKVTYDDLSRKYGLSINQVRWRVKKIILKLKK